VLRGEEGRRRQDGSATNQSEACYFKEANAVAEDPASRQGYRRVQAKLHPDLEWQDVAGPAGPIGGVAISVSETPVTLEIEELPAGPAVAASGSG
jgi:hypothetical protein